MKGLKISALPPVTRLTATVWSGVKMDCSAPPSSLPKKLCWNSPNGMLPQKKKNLPNAIKSNPRLNICYIRLDLVLYYPRKIKFGFWTLDILTLEIVKLFTS